MTMTIMDFKRAVIARDVEISNLRAELAALREPVGDLVEVAAAAIEHVHSRDGIVEAVLDAVLPRVRAEANGVVAEIAAERRRQIEMEGWTPSHDDRHTNGEMPLAAAAYAYCTAFGDDERRRGFRAPFWPASWSLTWYKPKSRRRDLIRAGALIVAEIERLDRLPPPPDAAP